MKCIVENQPTYTLKGMTGMERDVLHSILDTASPSKVKAALRREGLDVPAPRVSQIIDAIWKEVGGSL